MRAETDDVDPTEGTSIGAHKPLEENKRLWEPLCQESVMNLDVVDGRNTSTRPALSKRDQPTITVEVVNITLKPPTLVIVVDFVLDVIGVDVEARVNHRFIITNQSP